MKTRTDFNTTKDVEAAIQAHEAFAMLDYFGDLLAREPLSHQHQALFLATLRAFFREIPGGILSLALRVTDDWEARHEYEGTAKGAFILYADVDEYGLHDLDLGKLETHHQMFRRLAEHLGVHSRELGDPINILPEGIRMGSLTTEYYRQKPIAEALGFHWASEATSCQEFNLFLRGFQKHASAYRLTGDDDPVLAFFRVHTLVEPKHKANSIGIIEAYQAMTGDSAVLQAAWQGAKAFLDGFAEMFAAINAAVESGDRPRRAKCA